MTALEFEFKAALCLHDYYNVHHRAPSTVVVDIGTYANVYALNPDLRVKFRAKRIPVVYLWHVEPGIILLNSSITGKMTTY